MFVYLSKKIAIPNKLGVLAVDWNVEEGWVACGGEQGLLKVIRLEAPDGKSVVSSGANLTVNQALEAHSSSVVRVSWNHTKRRLTTADTNGLIVVWIYHKGEWVEEMVNSRAKSSVSDLRWNVEGSKICIAYEDGSVIVGGVDGDRVWGKDLGMELKVVEWSPSGKEILFGNGDNEVFMYDAATGTQTCKLQRYALEGISPAGIDLVGMSWYDGIEGHCDPNAPTLAICFANGRCQLTRGIQDDAPIVIDTQMNNLGCRWNPSGSVVAIYGQQKSRSGDRMINLVQFYTPFGMHLKTLRVPGEQLRSFAWEGTGLRVVLGVDNFLYFGNVRPDYKWAYVGKTLAYAFTRPDRLDQCVIFWNTKTGEKFVKYVKKLMAVRSCGNHCLLIARTDDIITKRWILIVCNSIGSPIISCSIKVEPLFVTMNKTHVFVANESTLLSWRYGEASEETPMDALLKRALEHGDSRESKDGAEEVSSDQTSKNALDGDAESRIQSLSLGDADPDRRVSDPVSAITSTDRLLIVARESGSCHQLNPTTLKQMSKFTIRRLPQIIAINCDQSRLAIIDINGILTFYDLKDGTALKFERKEVWDILWSDDNPELCAMMEKGRMYVFRGLEPEEPVASPGYLCQFRRLKIRAVLLDELMQDPDQPSKSLTIKFDTRSLRDTSELLNGSVSIEDAVNFISKNDHPRLWKLLAEFSLRRLDIDLAERAFVKVQDYHGLSFCKHLRTISDRSVQLAEVATYFRDFEEAERLYLSVDRSDLAIELRAKLGDWFRLVELVQEGGGDEELILRGWDEIGHYYADRFKWKRAVEYFEKSKNLKMLIAAYDKLEDYDGLRHILQELPQGSPLLLEVGAHFASVGFASDSIEAYVKSGDIDKAIDACVLLNEWDRALRLAQKESHQRIETLLEKYGAQLVASGRIGQATELYRKAEKYTESARLLIQLGRQVVADGGPPIRAKELFVLGALDVEHFKRQKLSSTRTSKGEDALEGLFEVESKTSSDRFLQDPWHAAEAIHFLILAQNQLFAKDIEAAFGTAMLLTNYDDIIDTRVLYSIIALTSYFAGYFKVCSRAFIHLESLEDREVSSVFESLAVDLFVKHRPEDPAGGMVKCVQCGEGLESWCTTCSKCHAKYHACISTGRVLFQGPTWTCKVCRHHASVIGMESRKSCPLCHSSVE